MSTYSSFRFVAKKCLISIYTSVMIVLFLTFLYGCTTVPKVHSLYDREVDFSDYRTYGYVEKLGIDDREYTTILGKYLMKATDSEMVNRGYTKSENPDLLVNFYVSSREKIDIYKTHPRYYHFRYGYVPWPYYSYETRVKQYTEGTLHIDLVDAKRDQLVWEGIAVGRVSKKVMENLEARVDQAVGLIFEQFPFQAGTD